MSIQCLSRSGLMPGLLLSVTLSSSPVCADQAATAARTNYTRALVALALSDYADAETLTSELNDYPLYPYYRYQALHRRIGEAEESEISRYLEAYPGSVPAERLREEWLRAIAEQGDWSRFLAHYQGGGSIVLQCYALRGRIRAGDTQAVAGPALHLWLVGHSQPSACDRLFEWLDQQGYLTADLLWKRFELAIQGLDTGLARALADQLSPEVQTWAKLWIQAKLQPAQALGSPLLREPSERADAVLVFALQRLSKLDPALAHARLDGFAARLTATQLSDIRRAIALRAALRNLPEARTWLAQIPQVDAEVHVWMARLALEAMDWAGLSAAIATLDPADAAMDKWRYWLARAYGETGRGAEAQALYAGLAKGRGYYAFLAADRLGLAYALNHTPATADASRQSVLLRSASGGRAQELYLVGEATDARREWNRLLAGTNRDQHLSAAQAAARIGWLGAAVRGATLTEAMDDLDLRFPLAYQDAVSEAVRAQSLDASVLNGLIRRESGFDSDARSSAGALGLTQMLPETARNTARKQGIFFAGADSLRLPENNIQLGALYFREQLDNFYGQPILALAAYNAGPKRVERWLAERGSGPADLWIEQIPFVETRNYVQAVLTYASIYDWKLSAGQRRLSERMPDVGAAPAVSR
jgi:soluble lytic murein transglycosylase